MKLNVISRQKFGRLPQGSMVQSIFSLAEHQEIRNLREPSEFTMMHLDIYADYLRQANPRTESRAVRPLFTTLRESLLKLSSDAQRGWDYFSYQDLRHDRQ